MSRSCSTAGLTTGAEAAATAPCSVSSADSEEDDGAALGVVSSSSAPLDVATEYRALDGRGNNPLDPERGSAPGVMGRGAEGADYAIVMARMDDGSATMFLTDMNRPGIRLERSMEAMDSCFTGGHGGFGSDRSFSSDRSFGSDNRGFSSFCASA